MIPITSWTPADGLCLEPNALKAVLAQHVNLAITAGPGAGKTELLAQRADFLLRTGISPYPKRILAISFKVDASKNLKDRVRKRCGSELAARFDSLTFHAFAKRLIDRFRPALTGRNALDSNYKIGDQRQGRTQIRFADLVPLACAVLAACEPARNALAQTYADVFLDEFQDCTSDQFELISAAFAGSGARMIAVGDAKQRIMGWAGAMTGGFARYVAGFHATELTLYQNYRSQPRLRRMQNLMIRRMDPAGALADADIVGSQGRIDVLSLADPAAEAAAIANLLAAARQQDGASWSDMAVLVLRMLPHQYTGALQEELARRGVPVRNEQDLQDLASEPAARLIVDCLSVVVIDRQPTALRRLMETLVGEYQDDDAADIQRSQWGTFLDRLRAQWRALAGKTARSGKARSATTASAPPVVSAPRATQFIQGTIRELIKLIGEARLVALSPDYAQGSRLAEIIAQTQEQLTTLIANGAQAAQALEHFSDAPGVRIMTVHKCKGLEFALVVILGAYSTPSRTPFRSDGGQHSGVMADTIPR